MIIFEQFGYLSYQCLPILYVSLLNKKFDISSLFNPPILGPAKTFQKLYDQACEIYMRFNVRLSLINIYRRCWKTELYTYNIFISYYCIQTSSNTFLIQNNLILNVQLRFLMFLSLYTNHVMILKDKLSHNLVW